MLIADHVTKSDFYSAVFEKSIFRKKQFASGLRIETEVGSMKFLDTLFEF